MSFPALIAKAQKDALLQNVIEALDRAEEAHRGLQASQPHLVALDPETFAIVSRKVEDAYNTLASARQWIEQDSA